MPQRLYGVLCCDDSMNILSPRSWFVCARSLICPCMEYDLMCGGLLEGVVNRSIKKLLCFCIFGIESGYVDHEMHMIIVRVQEHKHRYTIEYCLKQQESHTTVNKQDHLHSLNTRTLCVSGPLTV